MNTFKYIFGFAVILILQLLCSEFINLWPVLYLAVIPLLVILLPPDTNTCILMLCAFAIGLLTDALSDGVLGLNAACCTLLAACRNMITRPMRRYDIQTEEMDLNYGEFRPGKLVMLLVASYLVFFVPYVIIDGPMGKGILYLAFRIILNVVVNSTIAYLLVRLWIRRFF